MITGWYQLSGRKVYYNSEGKMCYGEKQINGNWYYFNTWNGAMVTGWYNLPGKKCIMEQMEQCCMVRK